MKNKKILIALLIITLIVTAAFNAVHATEEVNTTVANVVENTVSNDVETKTTTDVEDEVGDLFAADQKVTVEQHVIGNAFVMGQDVTISDSIIEGDLFVMGMNVIVDDTEINGSVFALGQNVNFTGETSAAQVYALGQNLVFGPSTLIERDLSGAGETIKLGGTIGHNAFIECDNLEIDGKVLGDLNYSSNKEADIADGHVMGNVDFELVEESTAPEKTIGDKVKDAFKNFAGMFITLLLIGLVFVFLDKKFLRTVYASSNGGAIGKSLLFSLLGFAVIPLVSLILIVIGIGAKTGLALIYAFLLALLISLPACVALITGMACRKKYSEENKANRKAVYGKFVLISLAFALLSVIPILGGLLKACAIFLGFGAIIRNVFFKESNEVVNS